MGMRLLANLQAASYKKVGRAAQGPRGLAASTAPFASSLGRAVVSPREDSWGLPHETETASLNSFVVLGCPVHVLGGRPRGTRPGLASLL